MSCVLGALQIFQSLRGITVLFSFKQPSQAVYVVVWRVAGYATPECASGIEAILNW